jgi:SPP1 gp7 family putative phage head morphogenesis protein
MPHKNPHHELYLVNDLLEKTGVGIEKADPLTPAAIDRWGKNTLRSIRTKTKGIESKALTQIYAQILRINPDNPKSVRYRIKRIKKIIQDYAKKIAPASSDVLYGSSKRFYKAVKKKLSTKFGYPYSFVHADELAIDRVNKFNKVFIGDQYKGKVPRRVEKIIQETIKKNKGVMSRQQIAKELEKQMPKHLAQKNYFQIVAGQVLNVSRSYSHCRFYQEAQIDNYEVLAIIDRVTSSQCRYMDGTVLSVERTLKKFEEYDDAKSVDDIKAVNPWIKLTGEILSVGGKALTPDLTGPDLQDMGLNAPPFHANSFAKDTEVYTKKGWSLVKDVKVGDGCLSLNPETLNLEYIDVVKTNSHYEGELVRFKGKTCDVLVTQDHDMIYQSNFDKWKRKIRFHFIEAENFLNKKKTGVFYCSSKWKGDDKCSKDYAEFMGYYLSDGWVNSSKSRKNHTVGIAQIPGAKYDKILACFKKMTDVKIHEQEKGLIIYEKRMWEYLSQFGKCDAKYIPEEIRQSSPKIIKIFLDAFIMCDGHERKRKLSHYDNGNSYLSRVYYTTSKKMAGHLGELILKIGKRPSYYRIHKKGSDAVFGKKIVKRNFDVITIRELSNVNIYLPRLSIKKEKYNDLVYCVTLRKQHTLYVRRKGRCMWCGNCRTTVAPVF